MHEKEKETLLALNQRLLDTIAQADWLAYASLCDPSLTCFEPECCGQLVEGLKFHEYYFNLGKPAALTNNTMAAPHVRIMGDAAVISYTRLTQRLNADGKPETKAVNETRVWHKQGEHWIHVHFHRSAV
jgi:calcium/calmodulin-dependent protein kinase (CaM kinase) II